MTEQAQQPAPDPAAENQHTPAQDQSAGGGSGNMRQYLDRALDVLEKFGVADQDENTSELIHLLEGVKHLDESKVLAIADVIKHMGTFNRLVRENVENIKVGNRYMEITQLFDSVREDSKMLIAQLDDGKISGTEKFQNWWMKIRRGTPSDRFEKIKDVYVEVSKDTKEALESEDTIMEGYIDFRFALKEAEVLARELLDSHTPMLEAARKGLGDAQAELDNYAGDEQSERSRLELARDEARRHFQQEDRTYQLLKDIAENLQIGYDVGETLITKLRQTHDVKERVYRRAVTFFTTNEHVFTILGTVYTSQQGLHEVTQATEAMKEGVNKGLEDVANLGRELERAALRAGYGSTINPESVQKLVDAISGFQIESLEMITELRKESEQSTKQIRSAVEEGKQKYQQTLAKFARGEPLR
ncbi:cell surface protein [Roseimaritima sediminicola]|uniref:cell surface protein n=1 Tax=Roseimaritima sediminicola TaxID=2662066 RepID=UPI001298374B|nr:cell surface protein [Roseimaritima sediminicola]